MRRILIIRTDAVNQYSMEFYVNLKQHSDKSTRAYLRFANLILNNILFQQSVYSREYLHC